MPGNDKNAKISGADAVKLATVNADLNYSKNTSSYQLFKNSALTKEDTFKAFEYSKKIGLDIFTTVGDIPTAKWVKVKTCSMENFIKFANPYSSN